ncbi:MAG: endonuclease domain-containing protein [Planctomycetota bacterium]
MSAGEPRHRIPPRLAKHSRALRRDSTQPERALWYVLRNRRLAGLRFRRQQPIGSYVVDFYCPAARLVVEVDGETHIGRDAADRRRTAYLEKQGLKVLRVTNDEVLQDLEAVALAILDAAGVQPPGPRPSPSPPP